MHLIALGTFKVLQNFLRFKIHTWSWEFMFISNHLNFIGTLNFRFIKVLV